MDIVGFMLFRTTTWAFSYFDEKNISYINKMDIKSGLQNYVSPVPFSQIHLDAMDKVFLRSYNRQWLFALISILST